MCPCLPCHYVTWNMYNLFAGKGILKMYATKYLVNLYGRELIVAIHLACPTNFAFPLRFPLQPEQIQAEYKVLALQYHPDKNSGDKEAEAKFQQLKVGKRRKKTRKKIQGKAAEIKKMASVSEFYIFNEVSRRVAAFGARRIRVDCEYDSRWGNMFMLR